MKERIAGHSGSASGTAPVLSAGHEEALCRLWYEHHDIAAAKQLIRAYLHMVARTAMGHRGCGVLTQELVGEGYVGLMRAACRYDPACGTNFATYASWWVQAAIRQRILRGSAPAQALSAGAMPALYAGGNGQNHSVGFAL